MPAFFAGARSSKGYVIKSIVLALIFWLLQFSYQFYVLIPGEANGSVIRSAALVGATLIGAALLVGPLARIFPSRNYIFHRRTLGVLGFTFGIVHVLAVLAYFFNFELGALVFELNPYANPLIFGIIAFIIYIPIYITSTDWATAHLSYGKWKAIHRLVYIAWILTVLHFVQINPQLLFNPAGYLLLTVTALVFMFEIAAFMHHVKSRGGTGKYVGAIIIIFGAILFYLAYALKGSTIVLAGVPIVIVGIVILYAIATIRQRRKDTPLNP